MQFRIALVSSVALAGVVSLSGLARGADFVIADGDVAGLIAAINTANSNGQADTIALAADGIYTLTEVDNAFFGENGLPQFTSEIIIEGNGATIERSGAGGVPEFRILTVTSSGTVTLRDLTISGGALSGLGAVGGAIRNQGGSLLLENCMITSNGSGQTTGAGIYTGVNGTLTMIDCTVSGNAGSNGGGLYSFDSTTTIENCLFELNSATVGAGISLAGTNGNVTVLNSEITNNIATSLGGGIANQRGNLTLQSTIVADNTASGTGGGVRHVGGSLVIEDSLIHRNSSGSSGGGIYACSGIVCAGNTSTASVEIIGTTISENVAQTTGGGLYCLDSTLDIEGSFILDNEAGNGGGIESISPQASVRASTISGNVAAGIAGGIHNVKLTPVDAIMELIDCTVSGNEAGSLGGGVFNFGEITIVGCTLSGNTGLNGGGFGNGIAVATVINSTISGNIATEQGGGISNSNDGDLTVVHSTITQNQSAQFGSGISNGQLSGMLDMSHTIVAYNSFGFAEVTGSYTDSGYNIIGDGSGITAPTSFEADPMLGPLADNGGPTMTHALLEDSPAIDAGDCNASGIDSDQRGIARPQGAACDIGSFELVAAPSVPGDANGDGVVDLDDLDIVLSNFGSSGPEGDLDGNGIVDLNDLDLVLSNFGAGT